MTANYCTQLAHADTRITNLATDLARLREINKELASALRQSKKLIAKIVAKEPFGPVYLAGVSMDVDAALEKARNA